MSEHEDLLRSLLVERYRRFPPPDVPRSTTGQQVARAMADKRPQTPAASNPRIRRPRREKISNTRSTP
jgi:Asp-tRNA(Asn)/Glu-tRNA(Gln) amidotransferase B subunit